MKEFLALAGFYSLMIVGSADAQTANCASRATVVERLAETYGETRRAIGLGGDNAVMEVFASDASGSWTITVTRVDGTMCLVASGMAYEALADALAPRGNGA